MIIIRVFISFLCILIFYFMGLYAKAYYDGEKNEVLFGLSVPDGLKGKEVRFLYKRVAETKDGHFAFYFKNKPIWVKSQDLDLIKSGDIVSLYGFFGEGNIFYPEGCRVEKLRVIKKAVSSLGCLIAVFLFFRAYRFNFKLFLWEPRKDA